MLKLFDIRKGTISMDDVYKYYPRSAEWLGETSLQKLRRDLKPFGFDYGTTSDGRCVWFIKI